MKDSMAVMRAVWMVEMKDMNSVEQMAERKVVQMVEKREIHLAP